MASIVFAVIVLGEHLPNGDVMVLTVICTVFFCILLNSLSTKPFIGALNKSDQGATHSE